MQNSKKILSVKSRAVLIVSTALGMTERMFAVCVNYGPYTLLKQEGQHPLTGQRAPPISGGAGLIGDVGL